MTVWSRPLCLAPGTWQACRGPRTCISHAATPSRPCPCGASTSATPNPSRCSIGNYQPAPSRWSVDDSQPAPSRWSVSNSQPALSRWSVSDSAGTGTAHRPHRFQNIAFPTPSSAKQMSNTSLTSAWSRSVQQIVGCTSSLTSSKPLLICPRQPPQAGNSAITSIITCLIYCHLSFSRFSLNSHTLSIAPPNGWNHGRGICSWWHPQRLLSRTATSTVCPAACRRHPRRLLNACPVAYPQLLHACVTHPPIHPDGAS